MTTLTEKKVFSGTHHMAIDIGSEANHLVLGSGKAPHFVLFLIKLLGRGELAVVRLSDLSIVASFTGHSLCVTGLSVVPSPQVCQIHVISDSLCRTNSVLHLVLWTRPWWFLRFP